MLSRGVRKGCVLKGEGERDIMEAAENKALAISINNSDAGCIAVINTKIRMNIQHPIENQH